MMVLSLQLATTAESEQQGMRRINRLPVFAVIVASVLFFGVVIFGLSWRGFPFNDRTEVGEASRSPATSFGEQLKRGVGDGIIGEPEQTVFQPAPPVLPSPQPLPAVEPLPAVLPSGRADARHHEPDNEWRARLRREQDEQYLREVQRQRMARLQAKATAREAPLKIDIPGGEADRAASAGREARPAPRDAGDLYSAALQAGLSGSAGDPNTQGSKEDFFNQDVKELGYLPNRVVPQASLFELKRGSVIPATLISGLDSDLPGRLIGQVSQDVYDSATGRRLLIPQGAKVFGRYDSKVSFGQQRVLVIWTDLIFPDGGTLRIDGMAGTDAEGYGGFVDKTDRHLLRTFGSAALVAMIGTGIDISMPESSTRATQDTASDASRRNFAEVFGRVAEQTISKNLNVQPTIRIRPGYLFNILVDQDIIFPSAYRKDG